MTETTYSRAIDSHPDGHGLANTLPAVSSPTVRSTSVAYEDYANTSPFSYASSCDPSILTPISSVGSPSMQQQSKLSRGYSPSGGSQQPTPPGSSKIGWAQGGGSPMTVHPASVSGDHFDMAYVAADPKHHLQENPNAYYGNFAVPAPDHIKSEGPERRLSSYYNSLPSGVAPYSMMPSPLPPMPENMIPLSSAYQPRPNGLCPDPGLPIYGSPNRRYSPSREGFPDRVTKPKSRSQRRQKRHSEAGDFTSLEGRDVTQAMEQIELDPNTSEEWKCVLEAWLQTGHLKGKNQWQEIQAIHERRGFGKKQIQALQMMLTRAKAKCIWSDAMKHLLKDCWVKLHEDFYVQLAARFNEVSGVALSFNAANIEAKLVEMRLEDMYMDPETKIRPRKRFAGGSKKRSRPNAAEVDAELDNIEPLHMTEERHEELLDQIISTRGNHEALQYDSADEQEGGPNVGAYGGGAYSSEAAPGGAHQSERVARQACEEMIKTQLLGDH